MYKDFSPELWTQIKKFCTDMQKKHSGPLCAAFDADGTLWDLDIGEIAFHYHAKLPQLKLPKDPWGHYVGLKEKDPKIGYLWLAQLLKDVSLKQVRDWNNLAYKEFIKKEGEIPIFPAQKKLIELFQSLNIEVFIVTASVQWSVEEGAKIYGIPKENVIGVKTKILNDLVTDEQDGHITYREGKPKALLERCKGSKLIFCAGNTMGDYELLKASEGLALAVGASNETSDLFKTEEDLRLEAKKHQWLIHRF